MVNGKVILFNPRSAESKPRIPNSILAAAAAIEGKYEYILVDGNLEKDSYLKIQSSLASGEVKYFGCTVMPGPQLKQAILISKKVKEAFPRITTIWGGYFPSNHSRSVLTSGFVDVIINGPGDKSFPALLDAMEEKRPYNSIHNLILKEEGKIIKTPKDELYRSRCFAAPSL